MICPKCGTENGDSSLKCVKCWRPLHPAEKGPWLDSKPNLPDETPSKKLPLRRVRWIVSILLLMGVLSSVIVPSIIEKMHENKIRDLTEEARQEATRPTPMPQKEDMAPAVTNREESKVTLGVIPSLDAKVTSLRFFESGYQPTEMGDRAYSSQFQRDRSRYINWELRLAHPTRERRSDFQIDEIWYKPDGSILAKQSMQRHLQGSWVYSFHYHSWGWEEPSHWLPGQYRVELSIDGSRIAIGMFTII
jgi:hypothetical protein